MSAAKDLLGLPPAMRPIPQREAEDYTPLQREVIGGKARVTIHTPGTADSGHHVTRISMAPAPWEVGA